MKSSRIIKFTLGTGLLALSMLALSTQAQTLTTVWNPAANPTQPSDGLWSDANNWTSTAVPNTNYLVVLNVVGAVPCVVDSTAGVATCWRMNIGQDGTTSYGSLIVTNGGVLNPTGDYCAIGYGGTGYLDVESGCSVTFPVHMWIGFNAGAVGYFTLNGGTVNVMAMTGLGWNGGIGYAHINSGTWNLAQWNPSQSLEPGSTIDIEQGTINVTGNFMTSFSSLVSGGQITAYGGTGTVNVNFNGTQTVITATPSNSGPTPQSITAITKSGGQISITYATTPGFTYHLVSSTTLSASSTGWSTVGGSTSNNVTGTSVTYSFPSPGTGNMYYRAVSP